MAPSFLTSHLPPIWLVLRPCKEKGAGREQGDPAPEVFAAGILRLEAGQ